MSPLVWSILLLVVGLLLIMLEVFVPSGGILGFLAVASVAAAIGTAFYNLGSETGVIFLTIAAIGVPIVLTTAFKYWPQTPMGKRILLGLPKEEDVLPDSPQMQHLRSLVGREGVAKTMMLPSGAVTIDRETIDAVSDGSAIEPGERVRVVEVRGNRVVVTLAGDVESTAEANESARRDDILSQPIESFGLEGLEDPLA